MEVYSTAIAEFGQQHNFFQNSFCNATGGADQLQGNVCPNSGKMRHRKPFLGVCRRSEKIKEALIAFLLFLCYIGEGYLQVLFEGKSIFCSLLYDKIPVQIFFRAELSFAEPKVLYV